MDSSAPLDYLPEATPMQKAGSVAFLVLYGVTIGYCFYLLFSALFQLRASMRKNTKTSKLNLLLDVIMVAAFINVWVNTGIYLNQQATQLNATTFEFLINKRWFLYIWTNTVSTVGQRLWTSQLFAFMPLWGLFCYVESRRTSFPVVAAFLCSIFNGPALVAPFLVSAVRSTSLSRYYSRFSIAVNPSILIGFVGLNIAVIALPVYHTGTPYAVILWVLHLCFVFPILRQWLNNDLGSAAAIVYRPGGLPGDVEALPSLAQATKNIHSLLWIQWSYCFFAATYAMTYFVNVACVWQASTSLSDFLYIYWNGAVANHNQITATSDLVVPYLVMIFIFLPTARIVKPSEPMKYWLASLIVTPPVAWGVFMAVRESRIIDEYISLVRQNEAAIASRDEKELAKIDLTLQGKFARRL